MRTLCLLALVCDTLIVHDVDSKPLAEAKQTRWARNEERVWKRWGNWLNRVCQHGKNHLWTILIPLPWHWQRSCTCPVHRDLCSEEWTSNFERVWEHSSNSLSREVRDNTSELFRSVQVLQVHFSITALRIRFWFLCTTEFGGTWWLDTKCELCKIETGQSNEACQNWLCNSAKGDDSSKVGRYSVEKGEQARGRKRSLVKPLFRG